MVSTVPNLSVVCMSVVYFFFFIKMYMRARTRMHEVSKGQVLNCSIIGKMATFQPRRGLFDVCKGLKPSSRPALGVKTTFYPAQPNLEG